MTFDGRIEAQFTVPAGVSIAASNSGGGPTAVSLTAGTYFPSTFVAHVVARLNAVRTPANWTGTLSTGASGTGRVTLNWTGTGTYSITWTSTDARDMLGFTINLAGVTQGVPSVGVAQHRMLWIPDCPLALDSDTPRAPIRTDAMMMVSPRGDATTLVGNRSFCHTGLKWSNVVESKIWEKAALIANASWETFWKDAQLAQGSHAWLVQSPGARLKIIDHAGRTLGSDANSGTGVSGWSASRGPMDINPKKSSGQWAGQWRVELPELVAAV